MKICHFLWKRGKLISLLNDKMGGIGNKDKENSWSNNQMQFDVEWNNGNGVYEPWVWVYCRICHTSTSSGISSTPNKEWNTRHCKWSIVPWFRGTSLSPSISNHDSSHPHFRPTPQPVSWSNCCTGHDLAYNWNIRSSICTVDFYCISSIGWICWEVHLLNFGHCNWAGLVWQSKAF